MAFLDISRSTSRSPFLSSSPDWIRKYNSGNFVLTAFLIIFFASGISSSESPSKIPDTTARRTAICSGDRDGFVLRLFKHLADTPNRVQVFCAFPHQAACRSGQTFPAPRIENKKDVNHLQPPDMRATGFFRQHARQIYPHPLLAGLPLQTAWEKDRSAHP